MLPMDARPTEAEIHTFVQAFYARVREDEVLGPIFEARLGGRWDAHLERMVDFWSSVLRASGRYRGNPLAKHQAIPGLESAHYDRWLALFERVLVEVLEPHAAADVIARARRMRVMLDRPALEAAP